MSPRPIKFEAPKQSSYQQNLSQPVDTDKWYSGTIPTSYEIMGRIGQIAQTDKTAAANFLRQYQQFQSAPGTPIIRIRRLQTSRLRIWPSLVLTPATSMMTG